MYLTEQRTNTDCFLTSLSMFSDQSYEILRSKAWVSKIPYLYGPTIKDGVDFAKGVGIKIKLKTFGRPNKKAILVIPNSHGGLHAVYFDGTRVVDPSPHTVYLTTQQYIENIVCYFY